MKIQVEVSGKELRAAVGTSKHRGSDGLPDVVYEIAGRVLAGQNVKYSEGDYIHAEITDTRLRQIIPDNTYVVSMTWDGSFEIVALSCQGN